MMKKMMVVLMLTVVFLVMSISNAQITPNIDRQVDLDFNTKFDLATKGIVTWSYEDYIGDDEMYRCLISQTDYNLPCSEPFMTYRIGCTGLNESGCVSIERINYTSAEKDAMLDGWEKDTLEQIGDAIKDRREGIDIEKTREGNVTIEGGVKP